MEPIKISFLIHVLVKFCVWRYVGEVLHTCSTDVHSLDSLDFKTQAAQTISPTMFHLKRPRRPAARCKCSSMVVNNFSPVRPQLWRVSSTVRHRIIRVRTVRIQICKCLTPSSRSTMVYHFNHCSTRRYSHRPLRKVRIPPVRAPFLSSFWNRSFCRFDTVE